MGLFDELDIAGAADNPWSIPDNTYACVVSDLEIKENSKGNMGMTFKYKVIQGEHKDFEITEYKRLPSSKDKDQMSEANKNKAMSYIKLRLASLDIPESRMNSVEKGDLIGKECFVSTKVNGDYVNVRNVTTDSAVMEGDFSTEPKGANPFM